ncbi:hypothetical protein ACFL47_02715 [Candidatus Latescibacterota bacterium]
MQHRTQFRRWNSKLMCFLGGMPIKNLLCQCIVGSHLEAERLKAVHDVDIVTIMRTLDKRSLLDYWVRVGEIAQEMSTSTFDVEVEVRSGPLKPEVPVNGHVLVQLHLVTHDLSSWERVLHYPGCNRWTRRNFHIRETRLDELLPVPRVSTEAIHRDLCVAIENIESSTAYCRIHETSAESITSIMSRVPLSDAQCIRLALQAGIFGFENVTDPDMGGKRLHEKVAEIQDRFSTSIKRWRGIKRQLDEAWDIDRDEAREVKRDIIAMLGELSEMTEGLRIDEN